MLIRGFVPKRQELITRRRSHHVIARAAWQFHRPGVIASEAWQSHRKKAFLFTRLFRFARNDILMSCLIIELLYIFFLYFTIGILIPFSLANWTASSYPASAWRATPKPGSTERTRRKRFSVESWPSATMTMPA